MAGKRRKYVLHRQRVSVLPRVCAGRSRLTRLFAVSLSAEAIIHGDWNGTGNDANVYDYSYRKETELFFWSLVGRTRVPERTKQLEDRKVAGTLRSSVCVPGS